MLFLESLAIILGTTVGAGILGIPFALAKVGFVPGLVMLIVIGVATIILELMYAEVVLRTKEDHEIPGYGGLYLGFPTKMFALGIGLIGGYGSLLAYIIGVGAVANALFGGSATVWALAFVAIAGYIIYKGLYAVKVMELFMLTILFTIVVALGIAAEPYIDPQNLAHVDVNNFIIPYGVLMFAFAGANSIPQLRQHLKGREERMPKSIITGILAVVVLYAAFAWIALGVTGASTTAVATIGLGEKIGPTMVLIGNLLALVTMSTSFLANGLSMRRLFQYDYNLHRFKAWLATMMIPLLLYVVGVRNFIQVLGLVGGIVVSSQSIIIVLAYWKSQENGRRRPEVMFGKLYVSGAVLIAMYVIGLLLTVFEVL